MVNPLVSCIIPTYNRSRYVQDAINSALAQDYRPLEIIVVDDGSTDDTASVLASYGDKITAIHQENSGTSVARNTGVAASKGEYIAWLDSDDLWLPDKTTLQMEIFMEFPGAGLVYTYSRFVDTDIQTPDITIASLTPPWLCPEPRLRDDILAVMVAESNVLTPCVIVKRSVLEDVGVFDPEMHAEDWDLHFRIAQKYRFVEFPVELTLVRIHDKRKTTNLYPHAMGLLELRKRIEAARDRLLSQDRDGSLESAYKIHDKKFAETYYRAGKQLSIRGEKTEAIQMLREARKRNPWKLKYYTRAIGMSFFKSHQQNQL